MDEEMVMIASTGNKVYPIELCRSNITFLDQIGRGEYGTVHRAMMRTNRSSIALLGGSDDVTVAVKMLSVDPTSADQVAPPRPASPMR